MDKAIGKATKKGAEIIERKGGTMKLKLKVKPLGEPDADD